MPTLMITKIVREYSKLEYEKEGLTIGEMIDAQIKAMYERPTTEQPPEIMDVRVSFDPDSSDFFDYVRSDVHNLRAPRKPLRKAMPTQDDFA